MVLLTDDQKMIQDTARQFLVDEGSIAKQLRHWRDKGCSDGFGHALWKQFAELGLTGICIPESVTQVRVSLTKISVKCLYSDWRVIGQDLWGTMERAKKATVDTIGPSQYKNAGVQAQA